MRRDSDPIALRSPALVRFFTRYFAWYFARRMNALRAPLWGGAPELGRNSGPLVIYTNHPSWWDGALYLIVADKLFAGREHYAPLDAEMLEKYGFFRRIGGYGVDPASASGAASFLTTTGTILSRPHRAVWVAAQGRFADVREKPLALKPGVARLSELAPSATFVPMAIDYAFWVERGAEAFVAFGEPRPACELPVDRKDRLAALEGGLARVLDRLSADVASRDPARFETLLSGRPGVGGVYDFWKSLAARARGGSWNPAHVKGAP